MNEGLHCGWDGIAVDSLDKSIQVWKVNINSSTGTSRKDASKDESAVVLVRVSIAVKRHHGHSNSYKEKNIYLGYLTVSEV